MSVASCTTNFHKRFERNHCAARAKTKIMINETSQNTFKNRFENTFGKWIGEINFTVAVNKAWSLMVRKMIVESIINGVFWINCEFEPNN